MELIAPLSTKNLDHLGLVSGVCEEIGLVCLIDELTKSDEQRKVSVGTATKAMILNGLGFANSTLYLTPDFFKNKAVDVLLGKEIKASDLNSHSLSTSLDALYKSGLSSVFYNVSLQAIKTYGISIKSRHLDGTTFCVHGQHYSTKNAAGVVGEEGAGQDLGTIELKRGYNKQKRNDLRQFVFEMISSNVEGIPLFIKAASGNQTDKTEFPEVLDAYLSEMQESGEMLSGYTVADSALYSAENLQRIDNIAWISRVPETIKCAKEALSAYESRAWQLFESTPGYKYVELSSAYAGVCQRWLVVHSSQAEKRSRKTVAKRVVQEKQKLEKGIKSLSKNKYASQDEAQQALEQWYDKDLKQSEKQYHSLAKIEIAPKAHYGRGRRKANAKPKSIDYQIQGVELEEDKAAIEAQIQQKAQFILATNDTDKTNLSVDEWLHLYKNEQQKVERGFRFLKDPMFLLSHIFLELPRRIMALSMVMGLCLLVYTLAQFKLRKALKQTNESIPNQLNKPIQNPTMRWVFQLFSGIHVMYLDGQKKYVLNLDELHIKILKLMGQTTQAYYTV